MTKQNRRRYALVATVTDSKENDKHYGFEITSSHSKAKLLEVQELFESGVFDFEILKWDSRFHSQSKY